MHRLIGAGPRSFQRQTFCLFAWLLPLGCCRLSRIFFLPVYEL